MRALTTAAVVVLAAGCALQVGDSGPPVDVRALEALEGHDDAVVELEHDETAGVLKVDVVVDADAFESIAAVDDLLDAVGGVRDDVDGERVVYAPVAQGWQLEVDGGYLRWAGDVEVTHIVVSREDPGLGWLEPPER